jgi:predicted translin family RNA/ssDNA-binding protein
MRTARAILKDLVEELQFAIHYPDAAKGRVKKLRDEAERLIEKTSRRSKGQ